MEFTGNLFIVFLVFFFGIYFLICRITDSYTIKNHYIAWTSLIFYAVWYPPAIALIMIHSFLGRFGGIWISRSRIKKIPLGILTGISLSILLFFKYFNFFMEVTQLQNYKLDIILPLGISFYTFTIVGYYVDVYRNHISPVDSVTDAVLFITFWPHLASGPILRATNIFHNMRIREKLNMSNLSLVLILIATGTVKKLLIADNIGAYVNWNLSYGVADMNIVEAWGVLIGFAAQIYADFSGYSDMAIGFALLLGFRLPANFNYPYLATSLTEFWRRWHISLSFWLRDYLYFPLGGNRKGPLRSYLNILIVFGLSGLWHGAAYNFIIWGLLHGLILMGEKLFSSFYFKINRYIRWFITFFLVMITWVFFRLDYNQAIELLPRLFGLGNSLNFSFDPPYNILPVFFLLLLPVLDHAIRFYRVNEKGFPEANRSAYAIITLCLLFPAAIFFWGEELPFIYFQF